MQNELLLNFQKNLKSVSLLVQGKLYNSNLQLKNNSTTERDDPYWTSRKDSLELIELSSINKVSLGFLL